MYVCMYVDMQICMYVCMYVCMNVYIFVCMYISLFVCLFVCNVCMFVCMYVCMYVCMFVDMQIFVFGLQVSRSGSHRRARVKQTKVLQLMRGIAVFDAPCKHRFDLQWCHVACQGSGRQFNSPDASNEFKRNW
jgi:hypothetical protein